VKMIEELEERVRRVEDDVEERVDELKESIAVETKVSKLIDIGGKKKQTGLDRGFQDTSGKVNSRASRLVYTGYE